MPRFVLTGVLISALVMPAAAHAGEPRLAVREAWIRSVVSSRPAAGYFSLSNDSSKDRILTGASSPACRTLMLHRSVHQSGQDTMEMIESVSIPAHGTVQFKPGGYHLMCMDPSKAVAPGRSVSVTFQFADGGTVTANFAVRGATGR
jgi:periplasmic copper chaperone A